MQAEQGNDVQRAVALPLEKLVEHPDNPSEHTERDIRYLRASLRRFGQIRDLVVRRLGRGPKYQMIAGHGMRLAMLAEGWDVASCTVVPSTWTDVQAAGYLLIDNHRASDDDQRLLILWEQQVNAGEELATVGTDEDELMTVRAMLATDDLPGSTGEHSSRPRAVTDNQQHQHVKLVLYMPQVDLMEGAIKKTGLDNRGEAVALICRAFIENDWIPSEVIHA